MLIRFESPNDFAAIHALTTRAFAPMAFSDGSEPQIIDQLRSDGDLTLSLVAEENGEVIGHLALSPMTISGVTNWLGLGPISVAPNRQRQGIGSALVGRAVQHCKDNGISGIALIGNPAVYAPMGFKSNGKLTYQNLPTGYVQFLTIAGPDPEGELKFAPAFDDDQGQTERL
ncbi:GNAT family N-acetyltransferase [Cognatishimia maritima]|uniref:Putative acetyltransferase n=1 Tax=Cognatishimia maritima TaxID=870908 RepID=A0A1M5I5A9_9RHOB|nr:N-acetyltransferase [Cognatishimia maritima]SHG23003.1 putative acetyltransferase [Cognatishimia maritima]